MFALGVAAVATAGFLVYRAVSGKGKNVPDTESEQPDDETIAEELEVNFFIDPAASHEENEKLIVKWMNNQVEALLGQQGDGKLTVINRKLEMEDFFRLMIIFEGRAVIYTLELSQVHDTERRLTIKSKGIDSLEYIKELIADVANLIELRGEAASEVCSLAKINIAVFQTSFDAFIGDEGKPNA